MTVKGIVWYICCADCDCVNSMFNFSCERMWTLFSGQQWKGKYNGDLKPEASQRKGINRSVDWKVEWDTYHPSRTENLGPPESWFVEASFSDIFNFSPHEPRYIYLSLIAWKVFVCFNCVAGQGVVLDSERPHLVLIDDNLLTTGVTLYHLNDGLTTIGSLSSQDIRLEVWVCVWAQCQSH